MASSGTLLINRSLVASLLTIEDCMSAVERALRLHAEGKIPSPGILGMHATDGGFHIKAGSMHLERPYFAAKVNANFPRNPERHGLPLIQGVIALFDGENGMPLALMDSMEITVIRTGAATGVAARHLSRADARVATICGCGNQGRISLEALAGVRRLERAHAFDADPAAARRFAAEMSRKLGIDVEAVDDLTAAARRSDLCVTATPSTRPLLDDPDISPGTFVAGVGADNESKQELSPRLLARSRIVVDSLEQCATIGDLHHALEAGVVVRDDVHAELGEVIAGRKKGRSSDDDVIVFDSTGLALEDVAAAAIVYERAVRDGRGERFDLGSQGVTRRLYR
jgi:alanine dehydrogenase